jgi:hypothetical protein
MIIKKYRGLMNFANNKKIDVISMGLALGHITLVTKPSGKIPVSRHRVPSCDNKQLLNSKEQSVCNSATD